METAQGWHDLVDWVQSGRRPGGDDLLDPQAVAAPTFGCRYTDQSAYEDPADYRTRGALSAVPLGSACLADRMRGNGYSAMPRVSVTRVTKVR